MITIRFVAAFVVLALSATHDAWAIAPRYVSDDELAKYPIIVVAKWDKAPWVPHHKYQMKGIVQLESYTRLKILSVIQGKLEPGEVDLKMEWGITWQKNGTFVNSGTSTQLVGDVDDVTKPCLWFLKRTRSWDEARKDEYLTAGNYRAVQPLELKEFFVALAKSDAQAQVPKLLAADRPLVVQRVLRYVCGGEWPWPNDDNEWGFDKPSKRGKLLHEEASRVWDFVNSDAKEHRDLAASVYAELSGKEGVANMRALLEDKDPDVRGIAVGALVRHRDEASVDRLSKALEGFSDGWIACEVVKALAAWDNERVVPALIGFLQNDQFAYQSRDDLGIPALKARQALLTITGHEFPFDVEQSRKAWVEARRLDDKEARKRLLAKAAPGGQTPLIAAAIGSAKKEFGEAFKERLGPVEKDEVVVTIRLNNLSSRPVTLLKYPSEVSSSSPAGSASYGFGHLDKEDKQEFTTLQPNSDMVLETKLWKSFLIADPAQRQLTISYLANGNGQGVNAWIGTLKVEFGADWKEKREVKQVEETWENGNLKATGSTVNGVKQGEWNYFNEQGDRIRIAYPGTGRGTAICNSEHPENKGAGKRPQK